MNLLASFYNDAPTRETVYEFLIEHLKEDAVRKSFNGDDTEGIKEAKQAIDSAFGELKARYGKKEKKEIRSSV